ncbi:MAG: ABC transporter permease [Bryobacterales bacterium]|nr:ABC transporter permease [Bryobacterales bacterium]
MREDLLWAFRWLRKNPLFTAATVLILAVGIGANTAVFSIVDAVLLQPAPYASAGRIVRIQESTTSRGMSPVPVIHFQRWSGRSDLFEKIAPYTRDTVTLTGDGEPEQVVAVRSVGLFPLLGVRARSGRALITSDDEGGARNFVVLSDRLWQRRYHADPGVIGRGMTISEERYTIVGVMPPDFEFRYPEAELWTPLRLAPTSPWLDVTARLRPGVSPAQAQSALDVVAHELGQELPKDAGGLKFLVTPWSEMPEEKYRLTLIFVLAAVGLVLLVACADVGSLLLSRAVERQREIAIRSSLGAGFWQIARQLLSESLVLAAMGSAAGIAVGRSVLAVLTKQLAGLPIVIPHLQRVALNGRVLAFNCALCLLLALLCGLAPILLAIRTDSETVLRSGQSATGLLGSSRLFSTLIALETGFAFLLLVGSGLMIRSLVRLQQEDHGFRPDHVLTLRVPVGTIGKYDTRPRQMAYYREILERVKTVPGVKAAAIVNNLPLSGVNTSLDMHLSSPGGRSPPTLARTISPQYFAAMGIPLIAGRTFSDGDVSGAPGVAIINEYLARQLFPDRNPLGQKLTAQATVVGVVRNAAQSSYEATPVGEVYIPYQQFIFATFMSTVVVRTEGEPKALAETLRKQVWSVDANQPVVKVETMEEVVTNSIWRPRFSAWIFSVLGGLAVLLTAIGVYAVVAYTSTLRAREVGIRVALGARASHVVGVILRGAMIPVAIGLALSVLAALPLSRLLTNLLYGISSSDPLTYFGAGGFLLVMGAAASAYPAWRAATRDPLPTLRAD